MNTASSASGGMAGVALSFFGAALGVTEVQAIISIVVTILGFLITLTTTIIIPFIKKWRAAKKDGKISDEELDDLSDILNDGLDHLKK